MDFANKFEKRDIVAKCSSGQQINPVEKRRREERSVFHRTIFAPRLLLLVVISLSITPLSLFVDCNRGGQGMSCLSAIVVIYLCDRIEKNNGSFFPLFCFSFLFVDPFAEIIYRRLFIVLSPLSLVSPLAKSSPLNNELMFHQFSLPLLTWWNYSVCTFGNGRFIAFWDELAILSKFATFVDSQFCFQTLYEMFRCFSNDSEIDLTLFLRFVINCLLDSLFI